MKKKMSIMIIFAFIFISIAQCMVTGEIESSIISKARMRNNMLYWSSHRMQSALHPFWNSSFLGSHSRNEILLNDINFTSSYLTKQHMESVPFRAIGRIFFTFGDTDFSCTATVANQRLWTAGHCVHDGAAWATNVIFVPGYNNGNTPFGIFSAYLMRALNKWTANQDYAYDFANVILHDLEGQTIGSIVGHFNTGFNKDILNAEWSSCGYPSEAPFDGSVNYHCISSRVEREARYEPNTIRIGCDTAGGASGGPWIVDYKGNGTPVMGSVTSYKYGDSSATIYGPYFGNEAKKLYDTSVAVIPF